MRAPLLALVTAALVAPTSNPAPVRPLYAVDYTVSRKTAKDEVVLVSETAYVEAGRVTRFEAKDGHTSQAVELELKVDYRDNHRIAVAAKWTEISHEGDRIEWEPELQVHDRGQPTEARVSWGNDSRTLTLTLR